MSIAGNGQEGSAGAAAGLPDLPGFDMAGALQRLPIAVVEFVAVTVALVNRHLPIGLLRQRVGDEAAGLFPEAHRTA